MYAVRTIYTANDSLVLVQHKPRSDHRLCTCCHHFQQSPTDCPASEHWCQLPSEHSNTQWMDGLIVRCGFTDTDIHHSRLTNRTAYDSRSFRQLPDNEIRCMNLLLPSAAWRWENYGLPHRYMIVQQVRVWAARQWKMRYVVNVWLSTPMLDRLIFMMYKRKSVEKRT